jgi:hypothetical protein
LLLQENVYIIDGITTKNASTGDQWEIITEFSRITNRSCTNQKKQQQQNKISGHKVGGARVRGSAAFVVVAVCRGGRDLGVVDVGCFP